VRIRGNAPPMVASVASFNRFLSLQPGTTTTGTEKDSGADYAYLEKCAGDGVCKSDLVRSKLRRRQRVSGLQDTLLWVSARARRRFTLHRVCSYDRCGVH